MEGPAAGEDAPSADGVAGVPKAPSSPLDALDPCHQDSEDEGGQADIDSPRGDSGNLTTASASKQGQSGSSSSDVSGDEETPGATSYYDYESCSDHGEFEAAQAALLPGRPFRRPLSQRVEGLVRELRSRQEVFKRRQRHLAQSMNQKLRVQWLAQQELLVRRSRQMSSKLQSGKSRAWRHKWVFALVQADFAASAYWLGSHPETFYWYFTVQMMVVLMLRLFDYGVKGMHYYFLDFCYFGNLCILCWFWLAPTSGTLYNAADGACGLLAMSVVIFRNSCVPHDFCRMSNAYVHYPAVLAMLSVKLGCAGDHCIGMQHGLARPWHRRFLEAWTMYLSWAFFYASVIFVVAKKRIDRKKRETLYNYFAVTLGYMNKLPVRLRPFSWAVFMLSHQALFLCGVVWLFLPKPLQVVAAILSVVAFFHNGGRFYVDHFWRAYERNTVLYVDAAYSAMSKAVADGVPEQGPVEEPEQELRARSAGAALG